MRPGTGMAMPPPQTGMRTAVGTSAGTSAAGFGGGIREGKFTEQIYSMIRDQKYHDAVAVLSTKVLEFPNSRAATSLLAYCYYHVGDFQNAIGLYERLTKLCPENDEYKFHYAQAWPGPLPPTLAPATALATTTALATLAPALASTSTELELLPLTRRSSRRGCTSLRSRRASRWRTCPT